jgi:hypothetical protein
MAKKKAPKAVGGGLSASEIARLCDMSTARVYAELAQGRNAFEIIATAQRRKQQAAREATVLPIDADIVGHTVNGSVPAYSLSLARKEASLAELRGVELMERKKELLLASDMRLFASRLLIEARDILLATPSELADRLAAESDARAVERILRDRMEQACERFYQLTLWSQRPQEPPQEAA